MADKDAGPETRQDGGIQAVIAGNDLRLIESGEGRREAILGLIDGARHSVNFLFYMFNDDEAGEQIRDALVAASRRGVAVRLLIDSFGSAASPRFFATLAESGGELCAFHARFGRRYLLRNHQKLAIADDRIALIGGANIDETYLSDEGSRHWRDLMLRIEGPEVVPAARYFDAVYRWSTRKNPKLRSLRRMVAEHSEWRGPLQWKFSGPLSRRNSWWRSIGRDIRRARKLDMIFAYFAPPGAMLRRIGQVGGRGQARIITAAKSDNYATVAAARHSYSRLIRRHVQMYEYQPARLHTKIVIVDDVVHIGSSNFDLRSLYINLEVMLRIKDAGFAAQVRGYFERELEDCAWISPALHKRRANLWRRIKWAVSHFLVTGLDYSVTRRLNFRPER